MSQTKRDPLLFAAQAILWALIGVISFALLVVTIATPAALIFQDSIVVAVAKEGVDAGPDMIGAILLIMVLVGALLALAVYFFLLLLRIIATVKEGDPFIAENAQRLSRMGWVALAGQFVLLPLAAMALWIDELVGDVEGLDINTDIGIDFEGILMVLILFILARVFRKGAEMREELEGTV